MEENSAPTVDPKRTEMFQGLSRTWWSSNGLQLLKRLNEQTAIYIHEQLRKVGIVNEHFGNTSTPLQGLKVLDVGCGGGFLSEDLARSGCKITGIDPNADLIDVAKNHAASDPTLPKISYLVETIEEHCQKNAYKYDVVIANFVVHHVNNPKYFVECCSKCVKPDGSLFMSSAAKTTLAWLTLIVMVEYILRALPRGTNVFDRFIDASVTENFITSNGYTITNTQGISYNFMQKRANWFRSHSIFYIIHARRKNDKGKIELKKNL